MRRAARLRPGLVLGGVIGMLGAAEAAGSASAPAAPLPTLTRIGPYGDPLVVRGSSFAMFEGADALRIPEPGDLAEPAPSGATVRGVAGTRSGPANPSPLDPAGDDLPARPGSFTSAPTKLPGLLGKQKLVAPHLNPDIAVPLSSRTTVGVFGEVGRVEVDTKAGLIPSVKAQEFGAGVSLQYRFGK